MKMCRFPTEGPTASQIAFSSKLRRPRSPQIKAEDGEQGPRPLRAPLAAWAAPLPSSKQHSRCREPEQSRVVGY